MSSDAPFSLRQIVLDVLAENDSEDLEQLLKDVLTRIPKAKTQAALQEAVRRLVQQVMTEHRFHKQADHGASTDATADEEDTDMPPSASGDRDAEARAAHFGAYIDQCLDERWTTEDGAKRRLRDMTAADCVYMSRKARSASRSYALRAVMFDSFRGALIEHGAERIGDLPESFLISMFRRAA